MVHHFSFMKASQDYVRRQQGNTQPAVTALFRQARALLRGLRSCSRACQAASSEAAAEQALWGLAAARGSMSQGTLAQGPALPPCRPWR